MPKLDITGQRFGRLVALFYGGFDGAHSSWVCQCDCGKTYRCRLNSLRSNRTHSCGCLRREALIARLTTHGRRHTREFNIWVAMRARCGNPKQGAYQYYGGRGIHVCERWQENFAAFFADMGPCPPGHSIDRINNDGNYEPSNCRWATWSEQAYNRRPKRARTG